MISESDENAFTLLFHRYVPRLLPFAQKLTKEQAVAENIIQETFLKIWLGRDKLEGIESPSAWLYRIAANECYKVLRRKVLAGKIAAPTEEVEFTQETIQLRELSVLVKEAVATLPEQRRKIYLLSRESGMTIPQIAVALQLSPSTVKNTLVTSLKTVREFLERRGYALPAIVFIWLR
jgi:RNA polymerase sigma-70 factor (ECF subfamily)